MLVADIFVYLICVVGQRFTLKLKLDRRDFVNPRLYLARSAVPHPANLNENLVSLFQLQRHLHIRSELEVELILHFLEFAVLKHCTGVDFLVDNSNLLQTN